MEVYVNIDVFIRNDWAWAESHRQAGEVLTTN